MKRKELIRRSEIPIEYGFSTSTIDRWKREGRISPVMEGRHRAYYRRSELERVIWGKEKVGVGSTDEENVIKVKKSFNRGKINHFSPKEKNINVKKTINGEKNEEHSKN